MVPDFQTIRQDALAAGGIDVLSLRFRVVEYEKSTGELIGVPIQNAGFKDAVVRTEALIRHNGGSRFCLEPLGFIQ